MRPGVPLDPGPPWVEAVAVGYAAASVPLLGAPSLADSSAEAIDGSALSFLIQHALDVKRKEEEEALEQAEVAELEADVVAKETLLWQELEDFRATRNRPPFHTLSPILQVAVNWHAAKLTVSRRK